MDSSITCVVSGPFSNVCLLWLTDSMPQSCIDRMRMHIVMKREKILRANGNCDSGIPGYRGQHKYQPNEILHGSFMYRQMWQCSARRFKSSHGYHWHHFAKTQGKVSSKSQTCRCWALSAYCSSDACAGTQRLSIVATWTNDRGFRSHNSEF